MYSKKIGYFLVAIFFVFGVSLARADFEIQRSDPFLMLGSDFEFHQFVTVHNDNDSDPVHTGKSRIYGDIFNYRKTPVFHRYHPDQAEWILYADINLLPSMPLFSNLVTQNQGLQDLIREVEGNAADFSLNSYKFKIVVQGLSATTEADFGQANPFVFRPQYFTAPLKGEFAESIADTLIQNLTLGFLVADGLPLTAISQFARPEQAATSATPHLPALPLVLHRSGQIFQSGLSVHPLDQVQPQGRAADLHNVLSGPVPALAEDFLQKDADGEIKPRLFWSVVKQNGSNENKVATLHIFLPENQANIVRELNLDHTIQTFDAWFVRSKLIDFFLPSDFNANRYIAMHYDLQKFIEDHGVQKEEFAKTHYLYAAQQKGRKYTVNLPEDFNPQQYINNHWGLQKHIADNNLDGDEAIEFAKIHYELWGRDAGWVYTPK